MLTDPPTRTHEGLIAGILGATAVALWFLVYDTLSGLPGRTPSVLGQAVLLREPNPVTTEVLLGPLVAYTLVHFAVFMVIGSVVVWLVTRAEHQRIFWFALLMLVAVVEVFFAGFLQVWSSNTAGQFPVWTVLIANALALAVMLGYAFRRHPRVMRILAREVRDGTYVDER
jgi:cytochrome bd-type quinol oxidase subunit 2